MSETTTSSRREFRGANRTTAPRALTTGARGARLSGLLFVLPALTAYGAFVLWPIAQTVRYSFFNWDGILPPRWVGLANYKTVFTDSQLLGALGHAGELILFFTGIPVVVGLVVATVMYRFTSRRLSGAARTVLFLPQVVPLVAAGIAWSWVLSSSGVVNQALSAIGLGGITRPWLGDFGTALPSVGIIGAWVLLGLCTVLLLAGMSKIDPTLYEAAQIDGAGALREFRAITLPSIRNEIAVCVTVTMIAALSAFDIVYISTRGGPGYATQVPGLEIYQLAFFNREVGVASALAVVLMVLVLVCVLPVQLLTRRGDEE